MKRKLALLLVIVLVIGALAGCASNDTSEEAPVNNEEEVAEVSEESEEELWKREPMYGETLKIGYSGGFCTSAPGIANLLGYFEEEGLNVEVLAVDREEDAIGTNQIQITTGHIASFLVPTINGVNMVFTTGAHTGCKSLYVLTDSGIESTQDLIGKTIGVPNGIGDSDHNIGLRFLNRDNIKVEDVNFRPVEQSAVILAMENDEVQGAVLSDQFAEKFVKEGKIKYIRSLSYDEDFQTEACCVHALNGDFVRDNPITAKKATRAIKKAAVWMENNKEEATQMLFDNDWASGDFDLVLRMMEACNFDISDELTETTLINVIDDYKKFGIISNEHNTDELMDRVWNPLLQN